VAQCRGLDAEHARRIAAALERDSSHPLANAFIHVANVPPASAVRAHAGQGVEGVVEGRHWRIGTAAFACGGLDDGGVWLAETDPKFNSDTHGARARFQFVEQARPDAASALQALHAQGIALHLASGDGPASVQRFAQAMGITDAHARQTPADKLALVRGLQQQGRKVAMVGDGLNDAPVLAGADVSLAIGDGAALAQRAADLVLAGSALSTLPATVAIARRTRRIIRQNLAWALGYNLLALPLAATGHVTPWLAALGMALSSLAVTANALRLTRVPRS
jgi:Cu2+-exporting ATPase